LNEGSHFGSILGKNTEKNKRKAEKMMETSAKLANWRRKDKQNKIITKQNIGFYKHVIEKKWIVRKGCNKTRFELISEERRVRFYSVFID